ncbi:MAG: IS21 family transposase [Parvibaculum sp.]
MRRLREILRQKWVLERPHRAVAESVGVSPGAVGKVLARAKAAGLSWAEVEDASDEALEARVYGSRVAPTHDRPKPDPVWIHVERKKPGVTLELLHLEYLEQHPDGYRYTQFCEHYRQWLKRRGLRMRQQHHAGDKLFVDYSGKRPTVVDPKTGEVTPVELFVAVLGASSYTYVEATPSQRGPDFIASHVRAFEYFGGVARATVCDQLKSGVTKSCRYEPGVQRTYEEMALHYGTTVVPARPRRPRDKAKVEVAVQVAQRWILARLRNETFFSLDALNERIAELLEELNDRPMKTYGGRSRRALFEETDRRALMPLPSTPFAYAEWKHVKVNIDYHVEVHRHFYSVPYRFVHERLEVRFTAGTVEIYRKGQRVASHARSYRAGHHTTNAAHMPKAHRAQAEWTPSRIIGWARTIGPKTAELAEAILADRPHPEQGYRSCLGILRLAKRYGEGRLEAACTRAVAVNARSYRHVEAILKNGLDRLPQPGVDDEEPQPVDHGNIRGGGYYH